MMMTIIVLPLFWHSTALAMAWENPVWNVALDVR